MFHALLIWFSQATLNRSAPAAAEGLVAAPAAGRVVAVAGQAEPAAPVVVRAVAEVERAAPEQVAPAEARAAPAGRDRPAARAVVAPALPVAALAEDIRRATITTILIP